MMADFGRHHGQAIKLGDKFNLAEPCHARWHARRFQRSNHLSWQNPDGVEVMLEQWRAGTSEPPHSHPGDDMTVVVEGKMAVQFYESGPTGLVKTGEPLILNKGETGYIKANVIHDAKYLEDCKLVFVHDKAFAFNEYKSGV